MKSTILGLIAFTTLAAPNAPAQLRDLEEGSDHPDVSRFSGSILIGYDTREFDEFVLPLGSLRRLDSPRGIDLEATRSERLEGRITRILYVVPENRSPLEVIRNYERELAGAGFQTLYSCAGEECGEDDGWLSKYYLYTDANELSDTPPGASGVPGQLTEYAFNFPRDQRYLAAKRSGPQGDVYASVYVARETFDHFPETHDHPLVLLDVIETVPMETGMVSVDAASMAREIAESGHVPLYIQFAFDRAEIEPESKPIIDEVVELLENDPGLNLTIEGHTDSIGEDAYNKQLSEARARSVLTALTTRGIDAHRLSAAGHGEERPIVDNASEEGRAKNRRVELVKVD